MLQKVKIYGFWSSNYSPFRTNKTNLHTPVSQITLFQFPRISPFPTLPPV